MGNIAKYLQHYAEPAAQQLLGQAPRLNINPAEYQNTIIVPCYSEAEHALEQVFANLRNPERLPTVVVVVVNAPSDATAENLAQTRRHLATLQSQLVTNDLGEARLSDMQLGRWQPSPNMSLLIIDRCSTEPLLLNPKQGVGLARKLGADVALALFQQTYAQSPWIYSTDADAVLPADYFDHQPSNAGALTLPFAHHADDPELQRRSHLYEAHMRAYATRLAKAGSPYGFLSLGSALACHAEHYAQVRGFPKRNAGEDFYLLNKVAKTGLIVTPTSSPILLKARYSSRVPFGTGPALIHWPTQDQAFTTYPDQAFALLAELLDFFKQCSSLSEMPHNAPFKEHLTHLSDPIAATVADLDPRNQLGKLFAKKHPAKVKLKAAHDWFDALKTLRFVRIVSKCFTPLELEMV